ncbi:hypothetical protein SAMN02745121_00876 [Nannocystis exedens]|uniref:Uncharacterized protein n=1 Tax=Nannocystis exedens TaxID=54 RepID=A0A1I1U951_9BACT|nr:hypothetical protein [Nannocystis exedens]PCC71337.1 hypothetical protein NAEX_04411 [Nannocystis exedens]SFD64450.1 hypothetical protein SAMN02745121_00876 [Nannocystis exedens]
MRSSYALLVAAALAAAGGCLVPLDPQRDCGDGYVDKLAGEECEPSLAESMVGYCAADEVPAADACDRETCTFDRDACTRCGNGVLDPGEACDPTDMSPPPCPIEGTARCRSDCTLDVSGCPRTCGDSVVDVDLGEECDFGPAKDLTDKGAPVEIDCKDLKPPTYRAYGGGTSSRCIDCKWDRSDCTYCGNARLESTEVIDKEDLHLDDGNQHEFEPEVCDDGVAPDPQALSAFCQDRCDAGGLMVACTYACSERCDVFLEPADGGPDNGCCTPSSAQCPYNENGELLNKRKPCCGLEGMDLQQDPCVVSVESPGNYSRTCP